MESRTASGLVVETRAAFPRDTPNDNDPASVPPGTVGPHTTGDAHGVQMIPYEPGPPAFPPPRAQPWAGWPSEWQTPNWFGRVETLTDTAWMCLDRNAGVIASMPPYLVGASSSLPVDWLNNPDPDTYVSWFEFAKQLAWDFQLGEAFIVATARYSNGYPARFHVVAPWMVNIDILGDGSLRYTIGTVDVTPDVLHIRYQWHTGDAHGHGPLEAGAGRLIAANALLRYATGLAAAGGIPHAVLKHPARLNHDQAADLQYRWVESRMSSMGMPAVLSGGIEFETLSFSPNDMGLVDLARWNESRIAQLLGIPPFLVGLPSGGDSLTYTNGVELRLDHWQSGLKPKVAPIMQALSGWALPRGTTIELNRDEYLDRGPMETAQVDQILFNIQDPVTGERAKELAEIRESQRLSNAAPSQTLTSGVLQ